MIATIVPAHNEQDLIGACLRSLRTAARSPLLGGEPVLLVVALDACSDATAEIAHRMLATCITVNACNVAIARAVGARLALAAGARWLSFADADTTVGPEWFSAQLGLGADAVCGTVAVNESGSYRTRMRSRFAATPTDPEGHRHIHGANLGVSAQAYDRSGGFDALESGEDVALVAPLRASGASIAWSSAPCVFTSARRVPLARAGFGSTPQCIEREAPLRSAHTVSQTIAAHPQA